MAFRGTFEHSLDVKHRLTIPARFRAALAGGVVLAPSPEIEAGQARAVAIWSPPDFEDFLERILSGVNPAAPQARTVSRFYNNNSFETELDTAHRVMIPPHLRGYAGLGREVTVTGSGGFLEVMDRAAQAQEFASSLDRLPDLLLSLGNTE